MWSGTVLWWFGESGKGIVVCAVCMLRWKTSVYLLVGHLFCKHNLKEVEEWGTESDSFNVSASVNVFKCTFARVSPERKQHVTDSRTIVSHRHRNKANMRPCAKADHGIEFMTSYRVNNNVHIRCTDREVQWEWATEVSALWVMSYSVSAQKDKRLSSNIHKVYKLQLLKYTSTLMKRQLQMEKVNMHEGNSFSLTKCIVIYRPPYHNQLTLTLCQILLITLLPLHPTFPASLLHCCWLWFIVHCANVGVCIAGCRVRLPTCHLREISLGRSDCTWRRRSCYNAAQTSSQLARLLLKMYVQRNKALIKYCHFKGVWLITWRFLGHVTETFSSLRCFHLILESLHFEFLLPIKHCALLYHKHDKNAVYFY